MLRRASSIVSRYYTEALESFFTRILYFFNTINSYFFVAGLASFFLVTPAGFRPVHIAFAAAFVLATARTADFFPYFSVAIVPALALLGWALELQASSVALLLVTNIIFFFVVQFLFMGIPDSIVARDVRVPFIKMFNSLFTVAPTTVSFSMSVFFSFYLSFMMQATSSCRDGADYYRLGWTCLYILGCAVATRLLLPKNRFSKFHKPDIPHAALFRRVVLLNIDGVRKDVFDALDLPTMKRMAAEGASHPSGLETVYRALTNPAFVSILTGTIPRFHGVRDNNLGQSIAVEGLPDIVPSLAYGSMHVKHFSKKVWETRIVSLPRHSIYRSDDIMVSWLKDDIHRRQEVRLFVADFSEADFLAHAYGSRSRHYAEALKRTDARIGDILLWMEQEGVLNDTAVIVCSDHGIAAIDHSYLIAESERYVPFFIYGSGVRKGSIISRPGKIMDICCTVAYLLGVRYPAASRGQVFTEVLEACDAEEEREVLARRFNSIKYSVEAASYSQKHPEVCEGDSGWWNESIAKHVDGSGRGLRVLDVGCGNGFVGKRFAGSGVDFETFVCTDVSEGMLDEARKALGGDRRFFFESGLGGLAGPFDIIAASSVFHHIPRPERLARKLDGLLSDGGLIIGSHEPCRPAFDNRLFRIAASMYKGVGGGVTMDDASVREFNRLLRAEYPKAPQVCREEILQIVEYNSPLEQFDRGIDRESGFVPAEFFERCFSGYQVLEMETYSTFFHRPWLSRHTMIQRFLSLGFKTMFEQGNLFRFVLIKRGGYRAGSTAGTREL